MLCIVALIKVFMRLNLFGHKKLAKSIVYQTTQWQNAWNNNMVNHSFLPASASKDEIEWTAKTFVIAEQNLQSYIVLRWNVKTH